MKKVRIESQRDPATASLREMPEIDFRRYRVRRNRFAKRVAREGIELLHKGPSQASLKAMPEADFSRSKPRPNPYAERITAGGITLQVGRGRPARGAEVGPTVVRSVRLPASVWAELERRARIEGVTVHALVRRVVLGLLK